LSIKAATSIRWYSAGAWDGQQRISEWQELEAGQKYYIEGDHQEWGHSDFMTTGVELERDGAAAMHPNQVKEQQLLAAGVKPSPETWTVTIMNAGMEDAGTFSLQFTRPMAY
jgi:hypothetical protein